MIKLITNKKQKTTFTIGYINKGNTSTNKIKDDLNKEQLEKIEEDTVETFQKRERERKDLSNK